MTLGKQIRDVPLENLTTSVVIPARLSFQLMTCAEPVEIVIASIKSLLAIKSVDDEILIIDNNNTNTELYEPLAKFCNALDPQCNVHFYHVDAVVGFKAGALNLALGLMNPQCTHVVVVDSDYQALPQARQSIAAAIKNYPTHALLQFPQFYRDAKRVEVHSELNHYFNYHLYRPFNRQRALSTGTYAVIRRDALLSLGGWSGASITEDAQMGVLMHKQGLSSQFIPEVIATGLLPTTISDLMNQRRRWIYGNAQVLSSYDAISTLHPSKQLSELSSSISNEHKNNINDRLAYMRAHFSQLSAWINFTGIFIVLQALTLLILVFALFTNNNFDYSLLLAALYVVYVGYGLYLARRLWAYLHDLNPLNQQLSHSKEDDFDNGNSMSKQLKVWALHLNFWELGALSWLPVLWGRNKPFTRTPKLEVTRSERTIWLENIAALPKLLLVLNIITALIVAPFSSLYSPILFVCALSICLLKLWAAKVIVSNYAYVRSNAEIRIKPSITTDLLSATKRSNIRLLTNNEPDTDALIKQPTVKKSITINKINNKKTVNS